MVLDETIKEGKREIGMMLPNYQQESSSSDIQARILRREIAPDEYRVYKAGLEWDISDPIVIENREDIKSEFRWRDRLEPYHHQVTNLITFCRRLPVTLIADDVGLGKTISAGLIISELISRSRLSKILVVCPKSLGQQWREELLTKFNIPSEIAIGKDLIKADLDEVGAIITTYRSATLHLDSIPQGRFQMLVLDEAHKLRNLYGKNEAPQVAKCFQKAMEERRFRFVLMLTATPIHNRLWDLYSLVDLLTVARGHQNPFGNEGMFARKFIADDREKARHLKPESRDEFRSIVYSYMSRVRRGDAKLFFPERVVQKHEVPPTEAELELIDAITKPIQKLNRLVQISILQALTSSPEALMSQLNNMARNGTVTPELAATVRKIVMEMPTSAKLQGLGALIDKLSQENPNSWRLVVFTGRIETQTTIQSFLEEYGLKAGIINGSTGPRNQETLKRFRNDPPELHVIVSTEAGSEGINLQVANVLVNYDLPWNPMIVEQRIGRIQRLGTEHANVAVFNIMLRGTFEEYIVWRLMEKLQMASQAIGDVEALLEASGINEDDDNEAVSFEERIRQLVIASMEGKDMRAATKQEEQNIEKAKEELKRQEENINAMLGGMDGAEYVGPRTPSLPEIVRSMEPREFTLAAFESLGAQVTAQSQDVYLVEENGGREYVCFGDHIATHPRKRLYAPGTAAFLRLVSRVIASGVHNVEDLDEDPLRKCSELAQRWVLTFGGTLRKIEVDDVFRCFEGTAVVRVRATVAHDSYERLVEISCSPREHNIHMDRSGLDPLPQTIENPKVLGINLDRLADVAKLDEAISEFSRFYLERREQEILCAGDDERKKTKLEDEFTPRTEMTLVALEGRLYRQLKVRALYKFGADFEYTSTLTVIPHTGTMVDTPELASCTLSGKTVPNTCLKQCQITGAHVLEHLLTKSEISSRLALPEHTLLCSLSGKRILQDEAEVSSVTGCLVAKSLLKTSELSGKRAEPCHFGRCEFTQAEVLNSELAQSEVSCKRYRIDEQMRSVVSGKTGHKQEFVLEYESREPLIMGEAEQCEVTGQYVRLGTLAQCAVSQKHVLPSELERCASTGKLVLRKYLVTSSISGAHILEEIAVRSSTGKFCTPLETKTCLWSGRKCHPDDLRVCVLTGLAIHFEFVTTDAHPQLQVLADLLNGIKRTTDGLDVWPDVRKKAELAIGKGRCRVVAAVASSDQRRLAVCMEARTIIGLRVRHAGLLYEIDGRSLMGMIALGHRTSGGWSDDKLRY